MPLIPTALIVRICVNLLCSSNLKPLLASLPRFSRLEILLGLLDLHELGRVGGDDLVFRVRGADLDGHVLQADEEHAFSDVRFEQEIFLLIGQVECLLDMVDDGR